MDFACSHVVYNWRSDGEGVSLDVPDYHNTPTVKVEEAPPPLPPRRLRKPRPSSMTFLPPADSRGPVVIPPPVPPRFDRPEGENRTKANVNVVSLSVGRLVNISRESGLESFQSPVVCGKCSAALSCLSSVRNNVWLCEFCGSENVVDEGVSQVCVGQRAGVRSDDIYLPQQSEDDYQNLEDTLVVFCVDISGSMSITTEVASGFGSPTYVSRLEGIQDALQKALSSMLQESPRRRVALVTFTDEVVIYGDGTRTPLTLRAWALFDENHIWQQSSAFSVPHCIAETHLQLKQRIKDLREHGATALGPAALASVAVASRYPGSKVVLCTDGQANIGLGAMDQSRSQPSSDAPDFYGQVAQRAVDSGVIISVMTFEGTDCRLADIGRLADATGGQVNIVSIGTIATEIQSASADNVLATGATVTLMGPDGVYFPFIEENDHKVVKEIGNVTRGTEITFQFAVKPDFVDAFLQKNTIPFQLQLSFKTRDQQRVTRIITEQRPVTSSNRVLIGRLNTAVLGVHCAQLSAFLTMEGRVEEAQRQLKAQQHLLSLIRLRPIRKEESIYGNWMDTMTTICDDIKPDTPVAGSLSDEAAKVVYQMRRASSISINNNYFWRNTAEFQQRATREKEAPTEEK
ncbi:circularly permutated Ras protein 1 isoform X2 [Amphiprion ocellaris]|uniref:circularly permutated Ras protein 1 isoform X2 n=1 Tax=Amphiprion ocellaris TaxID=80972 RepID=UPI002410C0AA|nr:circularly permutated Ras protein 1 isoform X2 [Amphiprion ocellaris]